jgi:hypothetical protein
VAGCTAAVSESNSGGAGDAWPEGISGRYAGVRGTFVDVKQTDSDISFNVVSTVSKAHILLRRSAAGMAEVHSDAAHLTFGFFNPPGADRPVLMIAMNAHRWDSAASHG